MNAIETMSKITETRIKRIVRDIDNKRNTVNNYVKEMNKINGQIIKLNQEVKSINTDVKSHLINELKSIVSKGRFELVGGEGSELRFATTGNIIVEDKREEQDIHFRVNLGKLLIRINTQNVRMTIDGYENNIQDLGHIHPHVAEDGHVCWGNMSDIYNEAMQSLCISDLLDLADRMICSYTNDSDYIPYLNLTHYVRPIVTGKQT